MPACKLMTVFYSVLAPPGRGSDDASLGTMHSRSHEYFGNYNSTMHRQLNTLFSLCVHWLKKCVQ